ncbi:XRE family transcriptional regulator [Nocardioides sp. LMS-CY]|nr:XRE family transcriptional regulator [Nocardioides sp. LMS-CY]
MRELSRRIGISPSMLSQIENGHSEPSVATLYALGTALSLSFDHLLSGAPGTGAATTGASIVPPDGRATLVLESGVTWERLTAEPDPIVDALLVTYPPGSCSSTNGGLMNHPGHEYGYLVSGQLTARVGFESFVLEPGSSIDFDSSVPHLYLNEDDGPAVGLWHVVKSPPAPPAPEPA